MSHNCLYIDIGLCFGEPHKFSSVCFIVCIIVYNLVDHLFWKLCTALWSTLFLNVTYMCVCVRNI